MQCNKRLLSLTMCLICYVNTYYHYQLNIDAVNTYLPVQYTTTGKSIFDITFVMKIQTDDRCNKKSSSFTNTRTLSTKDNLTPQLTSRDKKTTFHPVPLLLAVKRLLIHNLLPVHVVTKR